MEIGFRGRKMSFSNALSKSLMSSEAPTFFAVSTKRAWRSASVSFGLFDFGGRYVCAI